MPPRPAIFNSELIPSTQNIPKYLAILEEHKNRNDNYNREISPVLSSSHENVYELRTPARPPSEHIEPHDAALGSERSNHEQLSGGATNRGLLQQIDNHSGGTVAQYPNLEGHNLMDIDRISEEEEKCILDWLPLFKPEIGAATPD